MSVISPWINSVPIGVPGKRAGGADAARPPADAAADPGADAPDARRRRGGRRPGRGAHGALLRRSRRSRRPSRPRARRPRRRGGRPGRDLRLEHAANTSRSISPCRAAAPCSTRSTSGCSPTRSSTSSTTLEDRVVFVDDSLVPVLEELAPRLGSVRNYVVMGGGDAGSLPDAIAYEELLAEQPPTATTTPSWTTARPPASATRAAPPATRRASSTRTARTSSTPSASAWPTRSASAPATASCRSCRCSTPTPGACPTAAPWRAPTSSCPAPTSAARRSPA